jgi:hypothetical protein
LTGTGRGGGIYAEGDFFGNTILNNTASLNGAGYGGGVYAYHVGRFDDNTVGYNIASKNSDGTGGGIYVVYQQNAAHNVIIGNKATRGGGVYYNTYAGDEDFTYNFVTQNSASGTEEITLDGGGGIASAAHGAHIIGNNIRNNTAYLGGGIQIVGGDLYTLQANQIQFNTSTFGGGIYVTNAAGTIVQNTIFDNDAVLGGGMYLLKAATPAIEENTIISNTATGYLAAGGGIMLDLNDGITVNLINNMIAQNAAGNTGRGGGVLCFRGNCNLTHNTIVDNDHGTYQEGVILGGSSYGGSFILRNNIIAGHSTGVELLDGTAFSDYNDFYDNTTNLDGVAMGAHDRLDDPQFVNRSGGDYHLDLTSPVIDQGLGGLGVAYDFEGDPRPHGAGVDIGADEAYRYNTYVSQLIGNDSTGDGSSDHPYATVSKGLDETHANGYVYVGRGQYAEAVSIERNVSLMGGYNEADDWRRDIALYETVLDAQGAATVVSVAGDGVYVFIDGFTITGGEAGFFGMGGGILVIDNAAATIRHNIITGNHAQNGGGGIAIIGDQDRQSIVEANIIDGNVSEGIFAPADASSPLQPEQGPEPGGGLFVASSASVVNNIIYGNTAGAGGDGLAILTDRSTQVYHNTIAQNGSSAGQGLLILGSAPEIKIYNNLIIGQGTGISATVPTEVLWDYNGFHDNGNDYAAGLTAGPHDAHGDPAFVDSASGNYHIRAASAAAGRGKDVGVTDDFDGDARPSPSNSSPDIGADEIMQGWIYLPIIKR